MLVAFAVLLLAGHSVSVQANGQAYAPPADSQGRLARAEYLAEHAFEMADEDHDGRLSRDEYRSKDWLSYREYDHNADGAVDRGEFADMRCGGYGPDLPDEQPQRAWCLDSAARDFRRLGRNGTITPRSIQRQADDGFHFNDVDHDGFVTHAEELTAARRALGR